MHHISDLPSALPRNSNRAWETTKITIDNPWIRPSQNFKDHSIPTLNIYCYLNYSIQFFESTCNLDGATGHVSAELPDREEGSVDMIHQLWCISIRQARVPPSLLIFYSITSSCKRFSPVKEVFLKIRYAPNLFFIIFPIRIVIQTCPLFSHFQTRIHCWL